MRPFPRLLDRLPPRLFERPFRLLDRLPPRLFERPFRLLERLREREARPFPHFDDARFADFDRFLDPARDLERPLAFGFLLAERDRDRQALLLALSTALESSSATSDFLAGIFFSFLKNYRLRK